MKLIHQCVKLFLDPFGFLIRQPEHELFRQLFEVGRVFSLFHMKTLLTYLFYKVRCIYSTFPNRSMNSSSEIMGMPSSFALRFLEDTDCRSLLMR